MGKLSDILRGYGGNFNDAWSSAEAAGDIGPVPRGEYICHVTKGELESSRSKGTPGYKIEFAVIEGEFTGRKLWHDCWLTDCGRLATVQTGLDQARYRLTRNDGTTVAARDPLQGASGHSSR